MMSWFNKNKNEDDSGGQLTTKKINDLLGVEITNLKDITKISAAQIDAIKELIAKHHLVIIKGKRRWTEEEQVSFTNKIGKLEMPVVYSVPPSQLLDEEKKRKVVQVSGLQWHSDRSYKMNPSYLSVFQMVEIPSGGTRTSFVSLIDSYNDIPEELKEQWLHYHTISTNNIKHPIFWKHPFNGKMTIYFDMGFTSEIINICEKAETLSVKNSNSVINYLNELFSKQRSHYKHFWEKGDIIVLDNYAVNHKGEIYLEDNDGARTLLRTTTEGIYF